MADLTVVIFSQTIIYVLFEVFMFVVDQEYPFKLAKVQNIVMFVGLKLKV